MRLFHLLVLKQNNRGTFLRAAVGAARDVSNLAMHRLCSGIFALPSQKACVFGKVKVLFRVAYSMGKGVPSKSDKIVSTINDQGCISTGLAFLYYIMPL